MREDFAGERDARGFAAANRDQAFNLKDLGDRFPEKSRNTLSTDAQDLVAVGVAEQTGSTLQSK